MKNKKYSDVFAQAKMQPGADEHLRRAKTKIIKLTQSDEKTDR